MPDAETLKTASEKTIEHYMYPEVKETVIRCSLIGEDLARWFVGDKTGWYYTRENQKKYAIPAIPDAYDLQVQKFRTLHYTLAFSTPELFEIPFSTDDEKVAGKLKSKAYVGAYTFGIDIDTVDLENGHGANIHDPAVKEAVESMATFFVSKLKAICSNSIYCLYSGGGIYIMIHHGVFEEHFKNHLNLPEEQRAEQTDTLTDALNQVINDWQDEFYSKFPQHQKYAKADAINGAKRVFKTIFSIHKKHPYAVIPLDKDNIKIDFEKAKFPLSKEVINTGKTWYTDYDKDKKFLIFLAPYISRVKEAQAKKTVYKNNGEISISEVQYTDFAKYPPCIQNMLEMPSCGAGATRALAILAAFLGQVGVPEDQAKAIWFELAKRWSADAARTNVFESWYKKMNCPSCKTINGKGAGYPSVDLASIDVCKPNVRCISVPSPVYYTDKAANIKRLLAPKPEKFKAKK